MSTESSFLYLSDDAGYPIKPLQACNGQQLHTQTVYYPCLLFCCVFVVCLNGLDLPASSLSVLPTQQITSHPKPVEVPLAVPDALPFPKSIMLPIGQLAAMATDADEDEGLKHFEQVGQGVLSFLFFREENVNA